MRSEIEAIGGDLHSISMEPIKGIFTMDKWEEYECGKVACIEILRERSRHSKRKVDQEQE